MGVIDLRFVIDWSIYYGKKKCIERWFVVYIVGYIVNLGREMSDVM